METWSLSLSDYSDANYAGDIDSQKSTSCYMMTSVGGAVSWQSKLQKCITLFTTKAEYIAMPKEIRNSCKWKIPTRVEFETREVYSVLW